MFRKQSIRNSNNVFEFLIMSLNFKELFIECLNVILSWNWFLTIPLICCIIGVFSSHLPLLQYRCMRCYLC